MSLTHLTAVFVETIFPREELRALLESALPMVVHFESGGSLDVFGLGEVTLVSGEGLRIGCKARLHWPALGIPFQATLDAVTVMLRPKVVKNEAGESLMLDASIEEANFSALPEFADEAIRKRIDGALRARRAELAFDFTRVLRHRLAIPDSVTPPSSLSIEVAWGKLRIDAEAIVFVMSVHTTLARGDLLLRDRERAPEKRLTMPRVESRMVSALVLAGGGVLLGALIAGALAPRARR